MNDLNLFIPITKVDAAQRLVYGTMTEEVPDSSGEIMDYASGKPEFEKWSADAHTRSDGKSKGNVRAMHSAIAAGKLIDITFDDANKAIHGVAKIVDDAEWEKVLEGVYTGFSIGGSYKKRWKDAADSGLWRYTPVPAEVSIVDNPCCPTATFSMVKADGTVAQVQFKHKEINVDKDALRKAVAAEMQQGWLTKDNTFYPKKEDALAHEMKLAEEAVTKKEFSDKKRQELADNGHALPDGSFPIEDEKDVKNAVHAIGRAKDPAKAKDHIVARAKELNATHLLPSEWEGSTQDKDEEHKEAVAKLTKGMGDVARTASIIAELNWLAQSVKHEEAMEDDEESDAPAHLESIIHELCEYLVNRVEEETTEITEDHDLEDMVMELAAGLPTDHAAALTKLLADKEPFKKLLESLAKAGARHSKKDTEHGAKLHKALEDMHGHMDEMHKCMGKMAKSQEGMEECHKAAVEHTNAVGFGEGDANDPDDDAKKSADPTELKKIQDDATAALKKAQDDAEAAKAELERQHQAELKKRDDALSDMGARLKKLEDQPLPAKGVVFAVRKGHEATEPEPKSPVEIKHSITRGMSPADARNLISK